MISKKKKRKGLRRNLRAFSGRNQKFKRFFQPNTSDLQKNKKNVFAEIRRLFLTEIENSSGFSGQKTGDLPPKKTLTFSSHKPALKSRWGDAQSRWEGRVPPHPPYYLSTVYTEYSFGLNWCKNFLEAPSARPVKPCVVTTKPLHLRI